MAENNITRLLAYLQYKGIHPRDAEIYTGTAYNSLRKGRSSDFGARSLSKFRIVFPDLNVQWVMTGRGNMIREGAPTEIRPLSTVRSRLKDIESLCVMSEREFERHCGLPQGFVIRSADNISDDAVERVCRKFPNIDRVWLKTGAGTMFVDNIDISNSNNVSDVKKENNTNEHQHVLYTDIKQELQSAIQKIAHLNEMISVLNQQIDNQQQIIDTLNNTIKLLQK